MKSRDDFEQQEFAHAQIRGSVKVTGSGLILVNGECWVSLNCGLPEAVREKIIDLVVKEVEPNEAV